MTAPEMEARFAQLRQALAAGQITPEAFSQEAAQLRIQGTDGTWYQIDASDGGWLRWNGAQWEKQAAPATTQGASVCACGNVLPPGSRFCPNCGTASAGVGPAVAPAGGVMSEPQPAVRFRPASLLSFVGLGVGAYIGVRLFPAFFDGNVGTFSLVGVTAWLIYFMRSQLAAGLRALNRLPILTPFWAVQRLMPRPLRIVLGLGVPFVIAYKITPYLSGVYNSNGFMVTFTSVAINTVVAYLFFARAPQRGRQ
jgi:hypothetical protein